MYWGFCRRGGEGGKKYLLYVEEGISMGKRPDRVGEGKSVPIEPAEVSDFGKEMGGSCYPFLLLFLHVFNSLMRSWYCSVSSVLIRRTYSIMNARKTDRKNATVMASTTFRVNFDFSAASRSGTTGGSITVKTRNISGPWQRSWLSRQFQGPGMSFL